MVRQFKRAKFGDRYAMQNFYRLRKIMPRGKKAAFYRQASDAQKRWNSSNNPVVRMRGRVKKISKNTAANIPSGSTPEPGLLGFKSGIKVFQNMAIFWPTVNVLDTERTITRDGPGTTNLTFTAGKEWQTYTMFTFNSWHNSYVPFSAGGKSARITKSQSLFFLPYNSATKLMNPPRLDIILVKAYTGGTFTASEGDVIDTPLQSIMDASCDVAVHGEKICTVIPTESYMYDQAGSVYRYEFNFLVDMTKALQTYIDMVKRRSFTGYSVTPVWKLIGLFRYDGNDGTFGMSRYEVTDWKTVEVPNKWLSGRQ